MRMDGIGYSGMVVQPYYDSLLVKYTASGGNWEEVVRRMKRALQEARIRGVKTNIPFLLNVLSHPVTRTLTLALISTQTLPLTLTLTQTLTRSCAA